MRLYGFWRSSAAYRARIALNLKGIEYDYAPINLAEGEQWAAAYRAVNPQSLVPAIVDAGHTIFQSIAIIEYLEETRPDPPLLPKDAPGRARVRSLALAVACEIHPLNNSRVLAYLKDRLLLDDKTRDAWYATWIATGFAAIEERLAREPETGRFCHGDAPTMADVCLVPQFANAERFRVPTEAFPTIARIVKTCRALPAFRAAEPARQADAPAA